MNVFVIARREFSAFLTLPFTYIAGAVFLFISGLAFYLAVALHNAATLAQVFKTAAFAFSLLAPFLTMHLLSAEAHTGTLELLLTAPVRAWEIVVGKFAAAFLVFVVMLVPTLTYLSFLIAYGQPDIPVNLSGYLGLMLLGSMLLSIGLLASALSANQIVAALIAVVLSALFWLVGGLSQVVDGSVGDILLYLSIGEHYTDFRLGLITTNNIIYFITITTGALFTSTRLLEIRRAH